MELERVTKLTRTIAAACVLGCCLVAASCGGGGPSRGADRPRRVNGSSAQFDRLPRYPRSKAVVTPTRSPSGIVQQTFMVRGARPQSIVNWFLDVLPRAGWHGVDSPRDEGTVARRGEWTQGGWHLVVAVSPAPTIGDGDASAEADAQYSFVLYPVGVELGP